MGKENDMKASSLIWNTENIPGKIQILTEIEIPEDVVPYMRKISEIEEYYNLVMNYVTGRQKKWWYGIHPVSYIFMGAWNDGFVGYNGLAINEHLVEDIMWDRYQEEPKTRMDFPCYMKMHEQDVIEIVEAIIKSAKTAIREYIFKETGCIADDFIIESSCA